MGYRSDVYVEFKITSIKATEIIEKLNEALKPTKSTLDDTFDEILIDENDEELLTLVNYAVKWYEYCYEDVDSFMNYMKDLGSKLNDKELEGYIHYIRIGEETDDVEEHCYGDISYSHLQLIRSVDVTMKENLKNIRKDN